MNETRHDPGSDSVGGAAAENANAESLRVISSEELMQGQVEVLIRHGVDTYRLRLTRNGKLILQK